MSLPHDKKFYLREKKILDHGHIKLVDFMGDDSSIVNSARVSYQGGTKTVREDAQLIDYLVRNQHTSPIEMVEFVFDVKMPMFIARQWVRHRTASINEISGRYSVLPEEYYLPEINRLQKQSRTNKQGSAHELVDRPEMLSANIYSRSSECFEEYNLLLEADLSRELARIILPLNTYTQMIWKIDLKNLLHFIGLRLDSHAQFEIREYAQGIYDLISPIVPHTITSWENHIRYGARFSKQEMEILLGCVDLGRLKDSIETNSDLSKSSKLELLKKVGI